MRRRRKEEIASAYSEASRKLDGVKGKVGAIGYCLGGLLAYLTATRTDVDVSVGYYAVGVENYLAEANDLQCPLVLHFAEEDKFCPPEAREAITEALGGKKDVSLYTYPGMDHAFATPGRDHYDKPATMMAYSRSLAALRRVRDDEGGRVELTEVLDPLALLIRRAVLGVH